MVQPNPSTQFTAFEQQVNAFHQNLTIDKKEENSSSPTLNTQAYIIDINTASREDWLALGLNKKQVSTLLNYQKKGGYFSQKEDLAKIYGIDESDIQKIEAYLTVQPKAQQQPKSKTKASLKPKIQMAFFDPNTANRELLLQVSIPPRAASTILNYRANGGHFRKKEDLLKIFGLTEEVYNRIAPYIQINEIPKKNRPLALADSLQIKKDSIQTPVPPKVIVEEAPAPPPIIDVNQSDQAAWESIKGIGPYFSKRIINYRDKLGGFSHLEQIKETYNFPDSIYQNIKPQLKLSPITRKIKINQCSIQDLSIHPYLSRRQAKVILNYRRMHGPFQQIADLTNIRVLLSLIHI